MKANYRSVYVAFDPYPSFKGASTHIDQMCSVLCQCYGPTLLLTLKGSGEEIRTSGIYQLSFESAETNLLKRAALFSHWVDELLSAQYNLVVGHFRDIWGGLAVLRHEHIQSVFEVNGLPSIEWPYRYPHIGQQTLDKLKAVEAYCLQRSVVIVTPSKTIRQHLLSRGAAEDKVTIVANGADLPTTLLDPCEELPVHYMIYAGALQSWQGVDVLLKSLRYLDDKEGFHLVICSSHDENHSKPYRKFAEKLGIGERIRWKYQLPKEMLLRVMQHAQFSVAPLAECSRNIEQGCSPLKILESMACRIPVIASDLPVVREIIQHDLNGKLFRAGRPADLARTMRILMDHPELCQKLGKAAQQTINEGFTWSATRIQLREVYDSF